MHMHDDLLDCMHGVHALAHAHSFITVQDGPLQLILADMDKTQGSEDV
jgi:hypothetical protein